MKDILLSAYRGLTATLFIWTLLGFVFGGDPALRQMIVSIYLIGGGIGACSVIYKLERLPLLYQTLIHTGLSLAIFLLLARWNEWFPFEPAIVFGACLFFLAIFFIIWSIIYYRVKKEIAEINKDLN